MISYVFTVCIPIVIIRETCCITFSNFINKNLTSVILPSLSVASTEIVTVSPIVISWPLVGDIIEQVGDLFSSSFLVKFLSNKEIFSLIFESSFFYFSNFSFNSFNFSCIIFFI